MCCAPCRRCRCQVFGLSVWGGGGTGRATPGSELLNLRYRNEWAVAADKVGRGRGRGRRRGRAGLCGLGSLHTAVAWQLLSPSLCPPTRLLSTTPSSHNPRALQACVGRTGVEGPGLSRGQRLGLGLGTVALPYAWARLCRAAHAGDWSEAEEGSWRRRAAGAMRWAEGAAAAAALANSWLFLVRGDYRCGGD